MSLNAKKISSKGGSKQQPLEPGSYPARLVSIVGLGLQEQRPYLGQAKDPAYEINITYELLDEFMVDEEGNPDETKPRWISETIPLFNLAADRAKSTKRYLALDKDQAYEGDWTQLLGKACSVTIVQNPGKGQNAGKVYNNVAEISAMRPKDEENAAPLVNDAFFFDYETPDMEVFGRLPDFIKERITSNLEFEGSQLQEALGAASNSEQETEVEEDGAEPENF